MSSVPKSSPAQGFDAAASRRRCLKYRRRILEVSQKVGALHIAPAFSCLEMTDVIYRALKRREAAPDQQLIPQRAGLIEQEDRLAGRSDTRWKARRLNLHQRHEAVHFRFLRHELRHDASKTQRFLGERGPEPVVARGG